MKHKSSVDNLSAYIFVKRDDLDIIYFFVNKLQCTVKNVS